MITTPSVADADRSGCLVLGIGNRLLQDDAAGPLVIDRLAALARPGVRLLDGGTMGLSLLPDIEACDALIVVDAARFGTEPGTVRVFENEAMDAQALGRKQTVHEVALADLLGAAALQDLLPSRRALVAVEPDATALGLSPTPAVRAALPQMVAQVQRLLARLAPEVLA
ncbi:hydrogenase maturation protease [Ideonella sp. 4Y11]|uniref:Hydrogenase maturation protease n=1 Tax=Ideonella aquatica TaxID=2824119 RepID=A0A941BJK9_9BURK|nr:hydrogenase maturation protease [Ideonella aquatica]MBQ0959622.1 hydrogenase maturation protease [Ideonella aquatica]